VGSRAPIAVYSWEYCDELYVNPLNPSFPISTLTPISLFTNDRCVRPLHTSSLVSSLTTPCAAQDEREVEEEALSSAQAQAPKDEGPLQYVLRPFFLSQAADALCVSQSKRPQTCSIHIVLCPPQFKLAGARRIACGLHHHQPPPRTRAGQHRAEVESGVPPQLVGVRASLPVSEGRDRIVSVAPKASVCIVQMLPAARPSWSCFPFPLPRNSSGNRGRRQPRSMLGEYICATPQSDGSL
jgi:hypothetical protein